MEYLKALSEISMKFISINNFEAQMNQVMETIGKYFSVSRVYIFIDSDDGTNTSNEFEWCEVGVIPQIENLQEISYNGFSYWKEELLKNNRIKCDNVENLSGELSDFLKAQNIKSIVAYPLYINDKYKGFIGFDECKFDRAWKEKETEMLKTISVMVSSAYEKQIVQKSLKSALNQFKRLFKDNPEPIIIADYYSEKILDVNDAFLKKIGDASEKVLGKNLLELGIKEADSNKIKIFEQMRLQGRVGNEKLDILIGDNEVITCLFSGEVIEVDGVKKFLIVMNDISREIKLNREIELQKQRLEHIIEGTHMGTWEWNIPNGTVRFNERWAEIIGYTLEELEPITIETWIKYSNKEDLKRSNKLLEKHFSGETPNYDFEGRMKHKNGHWVWILDRGKVIKWSEDGKPIEMFGTHTDITEKKELQNKIEEIAIKDALTGVYNRRYVFDRLYKMYSEYTRTKNEFAIGILDIDHFKKINDNYGHLGGDYILKEFTKLIESMIRDYDLLGRYGGEEFIVVFPNTSKENAAKVIDRILKRIRDEVFVYQNQDIQFTFSGGICDSYEIDINEFTIETLIECADDRLYRAKRGGRDNIVLD